MAANNAAFCLIRAISAGWYNFRVPTPFYHLSLAEELLAHPCLAMNIDLFLKSYRGVFMFGNTAPDVQVVSGQPREDTHFFGLPIQPGDLPAWEVFQAQNPRVALASELPDSQAAFLAGYLCHLQADWIWITDIFAPAFGPRCSWGTFPDRLYYHNVLRSYLDQRILAELPTGMGECLRKVEPDSWLPFVQDQYLLKWRDILSQQLQPGAAIQTVEVFSSRQGRSAPEYYDVLASEERMQLEVFTHFPLENVKHYRRRVVEENLRLLEDYLAFTLHPSKSASKGNVSQGVKP